MSQRSGRSKISSSTLRERKPRQAPQMNEFKGSSKVKRHLKQKQTATRALQRLLVRNVASVGRPLLIDELAVEILTTEQIDGVMDKLVGHAL